MTRTAVWLILPLCWARRRSLKFATEAQQSGYKRHFCWQPQDLSKHCYTAEANAQTKPNKDNFWTDDWWFLLAQNFPTIGMPFRVSTRQRLLKAKAFIANNHKLSSNVLYHVFSRHVGSYMKEAKIFLVSEIHVAFEFFWSQLCGRWRKSFSGRKYLFQAHEWWRTVLTVHYFDDNSSLFQRLNVSPTVDSLILIHINTGNTAAPAVSQAVHSGRCQHPSKQDQISHLMPQEKSAADNRTYPWETCSKTSIPDCGCLGNPKKTEQCEKTSWLFVERNWIVLSSTERYDRSGFKIFLQHTIFLQQLYELLLFLAPS